MRVLITGVAGFIGSRFAGWIRSNHPDVEVFGVDDLSGGFSENIHESVRMLYCKLGDRDPEGDPGLEQAVPEDKQVDVVFHFAAYAAECLSPFVRRFNYNNNVEGTAEVVNFCINRNVSRLVFTSSVAVYGNSPASVLHEGHPCVPIDPYGVAKLACEHDIRIAGEQHGLDWCVVRPHNVYGVGQNLWDKYRNVLGIWMREAHAGRPIVVFGDGLQTRQFTFIDDILPQLWQAGAAPEASKNVINVGSDAEVCLRDLATEFSAISGAPIDYAPARHEAFAPYCNHYRAKRVLNAGAETHYSHGIRVMWDWAQGALAAHPERRMWEVSREVEKGVYQQWQ